MQSQDISFQPDPDTAPHFYAGVPFKRLIAWVVDTIVVTALTVIAGLLTFTAAFWFWPLAFVVLGFFYRTWTIANRSATWGMRVAGIELRGRTGERFNSGEALVHTIAYHVALMFPPLQFISVVMMVATRKGQGLSDILVASVMINSPNG